MRTYRLEIASNPIVALLHVPVEGDGIAVEIVDLNMWEVLDVKIEEVIDELERAMEAPTDTSSEVPGSEALPEPGSTRPGRRKRRVRNREQGQGESPELAIESGTESSGSGSTGETAHGDAD